MSDVTFEWGVFWPDTETGDVGDAVAVEQLDDEDGARRVVRQFPEGVLVSRTVTRSPWSAS